jgi:hypothetical protein
VLRDLFASAEAFGGDRPVPIMDMADRTGLDETSINRIAGCLGKRGFATRRQYTLKLTDPARVLEAWLASWDAARQVTASFHVGLPWKALVPALTQAWGGLAWAWTGAAGAALVADVGVPLNRVCYVAARDEARALQRLRRLLVVREAQPYVNRLLSDGETIDELVPALPVAEGERGLFHVVVPFSERAQFYGRHLTLAGVPVVSTLQLLLDLARGPGGPERDSLVMAAERTLRSLLLAAARPTRAVMTAVA